MPKAIWNEMTLAESNEGQVVEGNYYFPPQSLSPSTSNRARRIRHVLGKERRAITTLWWTGRSIRTRLGIILHPKRRTKTSQDTWPFGKEYKFDDR